ncbi:hypothetical protein ACMYSQ_004282 [Aspergillus niger]
MRLQNLLYLIIIAGHLILKAAHAGLQDILKLLALFVVAGILCLLVRLVMATFLGQRLVIHNPHVRPDLLGRPLLFPAKLSHVRRFPASERYNYWYDYFMVGVPVGFRGRIGNLISIDNQPTSETILEKCWFTIDPAYYLEPGSGDRTLEEKLDIFLHNLGENPQKFPYAYMISVPRFLWWQKSAISYWYLYSPTRELTAMIMEINNSFYEKRNIFFRLTGDGMPVDEPPSPSSTIITSAKGTRESVSLRSHSPASKRKFYKGYWDKVIFGSPFEKVGGYMLAKTVDILRGPSLQSTLSSNNPDGQVKVTSRLASWGNPVDPLTASSWDIARFIIRWTHVGTLSAPRIVKEALRIRFRGNLKYLQRPEVHPGTNPRKETNVEGALEPFFREYLSQLAAHYQHGIATALLRFIISKLRSSSRETVIDRFVFQDHGRFSPSQRWNYLVNILHYHLSLRLPIESQAIVMLGFITARAITVGGLIDAFYTLWAQWVRDETGITPATGALMFAGWDMINNYIGQYYTNPFAWGEGL